MMNGYDDELEHIHRVRYSTKERLAGLFILIAAVLLVAAFVFSRQLHFLLADTFELHAYVEDAQNINRDTSIRMAGFEIGRVKRVEWQEDNILLTFEIREKFHEQIRKDSVASIGMALVGDASIEITRGNPALERLPDGAQIPLEETPSVENLIEMAAPAVANANEILERVNAILAAIDPARIAQLTEELGRTMANVRELTDSSTEGGGIVGRLFSDEAFADSIATSTEELAGVMQALQQRLEDLGPVFENTEEITAEMPALVEESAELAQALTAQLEDVDAGDEMADILVQLRSLLNETERTLRGIQNVWPIAPNMPEETSTDALPPYPPDS